MAEVSDEHRMLADTVGRFVRERLAPFEAQVDRDEEIAPELLGQLKREACALGLTGYNLPESLGAPGLSVAAQCVIDELGGRTSMALCEALGHLPGSLRCVDDAQRQWLLDPLLRAETSIAYALTEPSAGSDLNAITTRAERIADGWRLNGTKHFISAADHADHIIVLAATDSNAPLKSRLSTFIVARDNPGFALRRRFRTMGWRGHALSEFTLEDCVVPDTHVLGAIGAGFGTMMATVNNDRLMVAAKCVGIAQALIDLSIPYARERRTFGKPLAEHQAIQFMIADNDVETVAARALVQQAAALGDAGDPAFRIAASRAKLFASEAAGRVADRVMQLFGGAGYMADLPIERFYRDVRAFRIGEGTSEMQRLQIARHVLAA
jgi:alkylation response protein AidB-like acyl-CoA dehydrogenase